MLRYLPLVALLAASDGTADRALPEYRYFRALSIDLDGRPPTRDELAAFERVDFDLDSWIDTHLGTAAYAERLRHIYEDALRLEIGPSFQFVPNPLILRRQQILGPDNRPLFVYFRKGQRRADPNLDGEICLTKDDTGLDFPNNAAGAGTPKPITQAVLDARTVVVKPWWLYADYRSTDPVDRLDAEWAKRFPGFSPAAALTTELDGQPTTGVRVCREETQTADTGTVTAGGKKPSGFAKQNKGRAVSCLTGTGFQNSAECGCGLGLERCLPGAGPQFDPPAFVTPAHTPLGMDAPFDAAPKGVSEWPKLWWAEEARRFLDQTFIQDRDFRDVLEKRGTEVNGPLAQFYRSMAGATCCGPGTDVGYTEPEPLFDPAGIPAALLPEDTATWLPVADRGPHAAGILTMPIFLTKYGSRRARAHVAYSAFLCKDFVAEAVELKPSDEPDLTKRPGCSSCHQTLEPMASYFTRVAESDWTYLPASVFPMVQPRCVKQPNSGLCKNVYDPAFGKLRGGYAAPSHAEDGPAGLAHDITHAPEFAPCVVSTVAQAFLGRALAPEDDAWKNALAKTFVDGGYRMKPLVRAIVKSPRYRVGNDVR